MYANRLGSGSSAGSVRMAAGTGRSDAGAEPGGRLDYGVLRVPRRAAGAGEPRDGRRPVPRWRRLVRNLVLGVVVLLAVAFVAARSVEGSAPPVGETIVVRQGDTMWSIASRHYPDSDPRARIEQIERLNHRDGSTVQPGEKLQLPATR